MTEAEWLECGEPCTMLRSSVICQGLWGGPSPPIPPSDRKMRLLVCACCRRILDLMQDERCRRAVEVGERMADGLATPEECAAVRAGLATAGAEAGLPPAYRYDPVEIPGFPGLPWITPVQITPYPPPVVHGTLNAAGYAVGEPPLTPSQPAPDALSWARYARLGQRPPQGSQQEAEWLAREQQEMGTQADLVRDLLGNPFRPACLDSACRTPQVVALARAIYDERSLPSGTLDSAGLKTLAQALRATGCTNQDALSHYRDPGPHTRGCWALDLVLAKE